MENNVIDSAVNGKFTDFAKAIKDTLSAKLSDHETIASYTSEIDIIRNTKTAFAGMTGASEE